MVCAEALEDKIDDRNWGMVVELAFFFIKQLYIN
jgi:hypothetical protein